MAMLEHATADAAAAAPGLALLLHELRDLHVGVEELGGAPVETDALALVKLALAVFLLDAFGRAGLG